VPIVSAGALLTDASGGLVYADPNAQPQLITGLPDSGVCWISGSYLAGCDGSVYKVLANFGTVDTGPTATSRECRSWATSIRGLAKLNFPAGTKIWRITTQKTPPFAAVSSCNAETTGEVAIFYSEGNLAYETADNSSVTPVEMPTTFTPAATSCIPAPDEGLFNFYRCNDPTRAAQFIGTFQGNLNDHPEIPCRFTFASDGSASLDAQTDHMTAIFNGDDADRVAYYRFPTAGDQVILTITDRKDGKREPPFLEFYYLIKENRFGASAFFPSTTGFGRLVGCDKATRIK
jgi:hypothetical protein